MKLPLLPTPFHVNTRHVAYVRKFVMLLSTNCTTYKYVSALIGDIIQPMKFQLQLLAGYVPVKYGINFTADMGIFVWAVKWVWY